MTEDHLKLLQELHFFDDDDYGGPTIDNKRPFGNSNPWGDIAEILGWEIGDNGLTEEQEQRARTLWSELADALMELVRAPQRGTTVEASTDASERMQR